MSTKITRSTYQKICQQIIAHQKNIATRLKLKHCLRALKEAEDLITDLTHKENQSSWTYIALKGVSDRAEITVSTKLSIIACAKIVEVI